MDPRDFGQIFRGFLGLPHIRGPDYRVPGVRAPDYYEDGEVEDEQEDRERPRMRRDEEDEMEENVFNFSVLTDPLEMHRFFEQQMEELLHGMTQGFKDFEGFQAPFTHRGLEGFQGPFHNRDGYNSYLEERGEREGGGGRNLMLKQDEYRNERVDIDLDDREVTVDDLTTVLKDRPTVPSDQPTVPSFQPPRGQDDDWGEVEERPGGDGHMFSGGSQGPVFRFQTFGFSQSKRMVRRPDGSTETEEKVRNRDGSESLIVRRKIGDKEYETRTTVSGDGSTNKTETFTNMSDQDLPEFQRSWDAGTGSPAGQHPHASPPNVYQPDFWSPWLLPPRQQGPPGLGGETSAPPGQGGETAAPPPGDRLYTSLFTRFFGN